MLYTIYVFISGNLYTAANFYRKACAGEQNFQ